MEKTNKSDYTKMRIKEILLEFMKTKHIDQIKVVDITTALNINRGTFYLYYDSTYEPLQEIEDTFFEEFRKINKDFIKYPLDSIYLHTPHPKIVETLEFLRSHQNITKVLFGPYGDSTFQRRCSKLISDFFFRKAVSENLIREDDILMEAFFVGGQRELIVTWINNGMKMDNEQLAILVYQLMFGFYKSSL